MESYKAQFIEFMLAAGVLRFGDFVTKSGRKTPYFINTGNYRTGEQIARLGDFYAAAIRAHLSQEIDLLYGPAYKGIPLAVTTAIALYRNYQWDIPYCFNRKEMKDHGEGGGFIGQLPKDGDRVMIVEDVVTAGTAVRESLQLIGSISRAKVETLVVSVDRMEKGTGSRSTLQELEDTVGIKTYSIVTIAEIIAYLTGRTIGGNVVIDETLQEKIALYREKYGAGS